MSGGAPLFRFVQWEVPWPLGPPDGRYLVRPHAGEEPDWVLVLASGEAPRRGLVRGRRARAEAPLPPPAPVPVSRATVVRARPEADADAARAWLEQAARRPDEPVSEALRVLNAALHAHRVAAADPGAGALAPRAALAVRVGLGHGEQVAHGRWVEARLLPPPPPEKRRGQAALRPAERFAAVLAGRDAILACEELALRARADLDAGREREAALQLHVALEAAVAELSAWVTLRGMDERLGELRDRQAAVANAAGTALGGSLPPAERETVVTALERLEVAVRARAALAPF